MPTYLDEFREKIDTYFRSVTREQLYRDCLDAGLEFYSNIDFKIEEAFMAFKRGRPEFLFQDESTSAYIFSVEEILKLRKRTAFEPVVVRTDYTSETRFLESANKESNEIKPTMTTSSNTVEWRHEYGYPSRI